MSVAIDNRHPNLKVAQRRLQQHIGAVLKALGHGRAHVDVSLVTDKEIRKLNKQFRAVDAVTDVLSFALNDAEHDEPMPQRMPGMPQELGDIVISLDTALRQVELVRGVPGIDAEAAASYGLAEEVLFLATHGVLHLLGHDHHDPAEAEAMEALERQFMAALTPLDLHACDRTEHGLVGKKAVKG